MKLTYNILKDAVLENRSLCENNPKYLLEMLQKNKVKISEFYINQWEQLVNDILDLYE